VRGQLYPNWELLVPAEAWDASSRVREQSGGDARIRVVERLGTVVERATGEFIGFLRAGDELKSIAILEVVRSLNDRPNLDYVYTDEDTRHRDGRYEKPFFKPAWSPNLMMSMDYGTRLGIFRREVVQAAGGLRPELGAAQAYDLALRVTALSGRIAHCASPAYSRKADPIGPGGGTTVSEPWRRALEDAMAARGYGGTVEPGLAPGRYRVRFKIPGSPTVAIVVPTRDRVDLLEPCVTSVREASSYENYEIVVVDNESRDPETLAYLESFPGPVIRYPHPFSFARMMNVASTEIGDADFLLFLNNDTRVIAPDWIEAMLEHGHRREVGPVGARLLYPDGTPQHEGILVGVGGHAAMNAVYGDWLDMGITVRDCSAVTAACMLIRREVFEELGGFDERLSVAYNDVDLCLRARELGYQIVYTPHALLFHDEGSSRGKGGSQPPGEEILFRERWSGYRDPFYNPNLDPERPFELNWGTVPRRG
jgi:GT2 family glycosyltransferase